MLALIAAITVLVLCVVECTVYTTKTVVKVIEDPYINGTTYHGKAIAAYNFADSWSVCPRWSDLITSNNLTADAFFGADGQETISIDLSSTAGAGLYSDYAFIGINFYNSSQTLCSGFYCLVVYGPKKTIRMQIGGYEKSKSFNLIMPLKSYRKLFDTGHDGSSGTINWRFIQC